MRPWFFTLPPVNRVQPQRERRFELVSVRFPRTVVAKKMKVYRLVVVLCRPRGPSDQVNSSSGPGRTKKSSIAFSMASAKEIASADAGPCQPARSPRSRRSTLTLWALSEESQHLPCGPLPLEPAGCRLSLSMLSMSCTAATIPRRSVPSILGGCSEGACG